MVSQFGVMYCGGVVEKGHALKKSIVSEWARDPIAPYLMPVQLHACETIRLSNISHFRSVVLFLIKRTVIKKFLTKPLFWEQDRDIWKDREEQDSLNRGLTVVC